jgi:hypothetical protein
MTWNNFFNKLNYECYCLKRKQQHFCSRGNRMPKANALKNFNSSKFFNCSRKNTKYVVNYVLKTESLPKTEGFFILRLCSSDTSREGFWCFSGDFHKWRAYCALDVPSFVYAENFCKIPFLVINNAYYGSFIDFSYNIISDSMDSS